MAKKYKEKLYSNEKPPEDQGRDSHGTVNNHDQDVQQQEQHLKDEGHVASSDDHVVEQSEPAHQEPVAPAQRQFSNIRQSTGSQRVVSSPLPSSTLATRRRSSDLQPSTNNQRNMSYPILGAVRLHPIFTGWNLPSQGNEATVLDEAGRNASYDHSHNNSHGDSAQPFPATIAELRCPVSSMEHIRRRSDHMQADNEAASTSRHESARNVDAASTGGGRTAYEQMISLTSEAATRIDRLIETLGEGVVVNGKQASTDTTEDHDGTELEEELEALHLRLATDIEAVRRDLRVISTLLVVTIVVVAIMLAALICFRRW